MKNLFLLTAIFFICHGYAQNYYQHVDTVTADGITFDVHLGGGFSLSNAANIYTNEELRYKNGRVLEEDEYDAIDAVRNKGAQNRALLEALGDEVIKSLRAYRSPMTLFYVVGPDGSTMEVAFIMSAKPELLALPPSVFATLEKKLKQYVTWQLNDFAKGLEFLHSFNFVFFEDVPLTSEIKVIRNPDLDFIRDGDLSGALK